MAAENSTLNLALRVTADLTEAKQGLESLTQAVTATGTATQASNQQWDTTVNAQNAAAEAARQHAQSQQNLSNTLNTTAEQSQRATTHSEAAVAAQNAQSARHERIIEQEQKASQAQEAAAKAAEAHAKEVEKLKRGLANLLGAIDPMERKLNRLDELERKLGQSYRAGAIDAQGYTEALEKLKKQRDELADSDNSDSSGGDNSAGRSLMALAKPLLTIMSIHEIKKRTDAWIELQNRLRGVTETHQQLAVATEQVQLAATHSARPLASTAELYQRIATSGHQLSLTYQDIGRLTETVNKAVTLDGLSSSQQNSLIEQIGRAFAAGTLEGQRFNTVLRQAPALTQAIATAMGVTADSVLKMASQNKLSLEDVTNALKNQAQAIDNEYAKTQTTISSAFGVLNDSLTAAIGKLDQASGASNRFTDSILSIAGAIQQLNAEPMDFLRSASEMKSVISVDRAIASQKAEIATLQEKQKEYADKGGLWTITAKGYEAQVNNLKGKLDELETRRKQLTQTSAAGEMPTQKAGSQYNPEFDKYLDSLKKAENQVQKLSYAEQTRADIASGRLGKLTDEQKLELEGQAKTADRLKETTTLEKNLGDLRKEVAVTGQKNSKTAAIQYEIEHGWLKNATKEIQSNALALAKRADAQRQSKGTSSKELNDNQRFVEQLEKQATKRTEGAAALRAEEIATRNLTDAQRRAAEAANAVINAREFGSQNTQLQIEYMRDIGDAAGASLLEVRHKYAEMRQEMEASGNTEGLSWIDKLLPVAETKIRVDDLKKQLNDLFTYQAQQESSIQAQVQGGLLSEIQGRQRLVELHQDVGDKIKAYLPQLKELADQPGEAGEKIREMIRQLEGQLGKLSATGNELTMAFRDGLQGGIESSLMGLAQGTMSLSDAVRNLALSIVDSMAKIAAQQLAQMATSSLMGAAGGMGGMMGSLFASEGGQVRGPGTPTSDSIPAMLSDTEFVTRASVVQQPGALDFLHDFNRHGMAALAGWAPPVRHATGGLAGIPAPLASAPKSLPETAMANPSGATPPNVNLQQTLVFDAADAFIKGAQSVAGERQMMTVMRANIPTLKQMLGVK